MWRLSPVVVQSEARFRGGRCNGPCGEGSAAASAPYRHVRSFGASLSDDALADPGQGLCQFFFLCQVALSPKAGYRVTSYKVTGYRL